jgi:hypothetical protein
MSSKIIEPYFENFCNISPKVLSSKSEYSKRSSTRYDKRFIHDIRDINDFNLLFSCKFTIKDLKNIITTLGLPKCRKTKRNEIWNHVLNCMIILGHIKKIQRNWRNHFIRKFNKTLGPAYRNRRLSNNVEDFVTMDSIEDIDYYNFFSYKDQDGFVYSFHFASIYNLFQKNMHENPYNRIAFENSLKLEIVRRFRYNSILNKIDESYSVISSSEHNNISNNIRYYPNAHDVNEWSQRIFNRMDEFGNYTNLNWFFELDLQGLRNILRELYDIWYYRAQLTPEMRRDICPPNGSPFTMSTLTHINSSTSIILSRYICLGVFERLLFNNATHDNQSLGCFYILSTMTLVSPQAREALPWLYTSVIY